MAWSDVVSWFSSVNQNTVTYLILIRIILCYGINFCYDTVRTQNIGFA